MALDFVILPNKLWKLWFNYILIVLLLIINQDISHAFFRNTIVLETQTCFLKFLSKQNINLLIHPRKRLHILKQLMTTKKMPRKMLNYSQDSTHISQITQIFLNVHHTTLKKRLTSNFDFEYDAFDWFLAAKLYPWLSALIFWLKNDCNWWIRRFDSYFSKSITTRNEKSTTTTGSVRYVTNLSKAANQTNWKFLLFLLRFWF